MKTADEKANKILAKIETLKIQIAAKRDTLRDLSSDLEEILYSLDSGIDDLEDGIEAIRSGLDALSEQL